MAWENVDLMFPEGHTVIGNDTPNYKLFKYDEVQTDIYTMAREMIIKHDNLRWTSNGDFIQETLYDVNALNNTPENEESCLSVYGNKMIQDYYQRDQYKERRKDGEVQRAGFNYTGI